MSRSLASLARLFRSSLSSGRLKVSRGRRPPRAARPGLERLESRLTPSNSLGTYALVEGPAAGTDSDLVAATGAWTATSNASWLHTSSSGTGNGLATFTFDANGGATRSGTLTIAGQTLTVTQAGNSYVPANSGTPLVASGLSGPFGVAVDGVGNVFIADTGNSAIKEWVAATGQVRSLVSSGLNNPFGVAVDGAGNVYIGDTYNGAVKEWFAATGQVTTLVATGLNNPVGVAVDVAGNVYIADTGNSAIKEWVAATGQVTPLVATGHDGASAVAVDGSGNVYIAGSDIREWAAATGQVTTLAASVSLSNPYGVAVDGAGNAYVADTDNNAVKELSRALVPGGVVGEGPAAGSDALLPVLPTTEPLTGPFAPSSDQPWLTVGSAAGGVVPFAFTQNAGPARTAHLTVLGRPVLVSQASASAPVVAGPAVTSVTATAATLGGTVSSDNGTLLSKRGVLYTPTAVNGNPQLGGSGVTEVDDAVAATGGFSEAVSGLAPGTAYSFVAFASSGAGTTYTVPVASFTTLGLGAASLVEGPAAGGDTDLVVGNGAWAATANAPWLHTSSAGTGSGLALFTFDANGGAARSGTLTIAGQTLTVTQAGSSYVPADPVTPLAPYGLYNPEGVAVDGAGNVYFTDTNDYAVKEWSPATGQVTTLVSAGIASPQGVAVDRAGNVYFSAYSPTLATYVVEEWVAATGQVSVLVASGLSNPFGVAVDRSGNVYVADSGNNAIKEWSPATQQVTALVASGLKDPQGVAVDGAGNVYFADSSNNAIDEWVAATRGVYSPLFTYPLSSPESLAVDGSGNVYVADAGHGAIVEWSRATNQVTSLVASGLSFPQGVAVDGAGNVYVADTYNNAIKEWSRAAGQVTTLVTPALSGPIGVAADGAGNVYVADTQNGAIKEWVAATGQLTTVLATGLSNPRGLALDRMGNLYIADAGRGAIVEWSPATGQLTTLVASGLYLPSAVAVDGAGNVYIADTYNGAIKEWSPATGQVTTLVTAGLLRPYGVAVDGAGNVYIADTYHWDVEEWTAATGQLSPLIATGSGPAGLAVDGSGNIYMAEYDAVQEWVAATGQLTTLVAAGLHHPYGVAVDGAGNVTIADTQNSTVKELSRAFVPGGVISEGPAAGSDTLLPVLPATEPLTGLFAPTSDQPWLTLGSAADGVVRFSFSRNTGAARTAHIGLLGQSITLTQAADAPPVAAGDSYAASPGQTLTARAPGVLANDSDADGDPLTAKLVSGPAHGSLTFNADGSFSYTPAAGFEGADTFTYKANDGLLDSNVATVTVAVQPALAVVVAIPQVSSASVNAVTLTFNEPVLASSFTVSSVDGLTGPGGNVTPGSVNEISPTQYQVVFPAQSAPGNYALTVGPNVTDVYGRPMDQNGNGVTGEVPGDAYTTTFGLPLPVALPYSENFSDGVAHGFASQSGGWSVSGGAYDASPAYTGGDEASLLQVGGALPSPLGLGVTMSATAAAGSLYSNGFLVFDYQSPTDFKFAGAFVGLQEWVIGRRDANGWQVDAAAGDPAIAPGTGFDLQLWLQGANADLYVNGTNEVSFSYAATFNGSVGLGAKNSLTQFTNLNVQPGTAGTLPIVEDFSDGQAHYFAPQEGGWSVSNGRYGAAPVNGGDAVSTLLINGGVPSPLEFGVTLNPAAASGSFYSNGFVLFDYQGPTNFKYAGAFVGNQQWVIGHRDASGWHNDAAVSDSAIAAGTDNNLELWLQGANADLFAAGAGKVSFNYGAAFTGAVGLGAENSVTGFTNLSVRQPAAGALPISEDFSDGLAHYFIPQEGSWSVSSGRYDSAPVYGGDTVTDLLVNGALPSNLEFDVTMNAAAAAGGFYSNGFIVFDYQGPTSFKFAGGYMGNQQWVIGHRDANGWHVDVALSDPSISPGTDYNLSLVLQGSQAALSVNGSAKVSFTYAASFSGSVGLGSQNGLTQFDNLFVR